MKKKKMFSSPAAKRAEIEEMLEIAQKLTDSGYGHIRVTLEIGAGDEEAEIKNENI